MQKSNNSYELLCLMLKRLEQSNGFKTFLKKCLKQLKYQKSSILSLSTQIIKKHYLNFQSRFHSTKRLLTQQFTLKNSFWYENQLRIFIYILCGLLYLQKININNLRPQDYQKLKCFFPSKTSMHLEYQIQLMIKNKNSKWSKQQQIFFKQIIQKNSYSKRWNHIAKQLYCQSNKKYFKTPKQCRQRWINYVDPIKIKGNWTLNQDIQILTSISEIGKKWTLISQKLNNTRTENSVKNRYNSLIKKERKQHQQQQNQQFLVQKLLQKLKKSTQKQQQVIEVQLQDNQNLQNFQKQLLASNSKVEEQIQKISSNKAKQIVSSYIEQKYSQQATIDSMFDKTANINKRFTIESPIQELQNIEWNYQSYASKFNIDLLFHNGQFTFDEDNNF